MTRKDYRLIAAGFYEAFASSDPEHHSAIRYTARRVARKLGEDNPRFDEEGFMNACEPN